MKAGSKTETPFEGFEFHNDDGKVWMLTGQLIWKIIKDPIHSAQVELHEDSTISLALGEDGSGDEFFVGIDGNKVYDHVDVSKWINQKLAMDVLGNFYEHTAIKNAEDGKFLN
jgi:hypothetical protein